MVGGTRMQGGFNGPIASGMQQQLTVPRAMANQVAGVNFLMQVKMLSEMLASVITVLHRSVGGAEAISRVCYQFLLLLRRIADRVFDIVENLQRQAPTNELEQKRQQTLKVLKGLVVMAIILLGVRFFRQVRTGRNLVAASSSPQRSLRRIENHANHLSGLSSNPSWQQQFLIERGSRIAPQAQRIRMIPPRL